MSSPQMVWSKRVHEVESLVGGGHHKQALQEAGSVLEGLLKELYRRTIDNVAPADQNHLLAKLEQVGKGKPVGDLTLGQIVGLFRESDFFRLAERALGRKLPHISTANFTTFIDIRNRAVHKGEQVSAKESKYFAAQLSLFLDELGISEPTGSIEPSHSHLRPWVEVASLHPDVLADNFSEDIFALDLGPLSDKVPSVPAVYRDPEHFFKTSYLTAGLKSLLNDVLLRLSGAEGSRVLKLMTPFGGGKSHTLAALWHAAKNRAALDVIPEAVGLPKPSKPVNVAVFDGAFFDAVKGKSVPKSNVHANTMWGWLAWSLHGEQGYERFKSHDQARVAPGGDEILALLQAGPNLILLDEVLQYLISVGGIKVEQTTLRDETLTFLQRLTTTVTNTKDTALVFTLQSSKRESLDYVNLLQNVDHLAARKDQRREPVEGAEIPRVIQRRLLAKVPSDADAAPAAQTYQDILTQMRRAYAQTAAEKQQAEEEGIAFRDRIRSAYPFHPALVDLMRERWAAIPDFQRTRGALRFLAACLRAAHKAARSRVLLGPGDVPIQDAEVRQAFFKEVGQQSDFQAVLEHDFIGANARARRIDERREKESPSETGRNAAMRLATAVLMYSFGGLRRDGGGESDFLPAGITETELLAACVGPDLDSTTALACLKELREQCLYLHFDGARYAFKKDPNVTLLVEQEADMVARDEKLVRDRIKEMLEERLAGHSSAIVWPEKPGDIPDKQPLFQIAYLPLEFAGKPNAQQDSAARDLFEKYGDKPRLFKNGIGVAVPTADQVEGLRRAVRYILSAERVSEKARQLNLTQDQKSQLRERTNTEAGAAEAAILRLYAEVWLPKAEQGGLTIEKIAAGGRPLQVTLNQKKQAAIHERVQEFRPAARVCDLASQQDRRIVCSRHCVRPDAGPIGAGNCRGVLQLSEFHAVDYRGCCPQSHRARRR
jgi:uncharacterized protein